MTLVFSRVQDWFRYWWLKVPDPRIISIIVGTVYLFGFFLLGGIGTLTNPPVTIIGEVGEVTITTVGFLFLVGAVIGMIGGTLDHWELERVGVVTMGLGALVYAYIVISLHYTSTGSRLTQLAMILAGLGFLGLRLAMIWRYDYKPRG